MNFCMQVKSCRSVFITKPPANPQWENDICIIIFLLFFSGIDSIKDSSWMMVCCCFAATISALSNCLRLPWKTMIWQYINLFMENSYGGEGGGERQGKWGWWRALTTTPINHYCDQTRNKRNAKRKKRVRSHFQLQMLKTQNKTTSIVFVSFGWMPIMKSTHTHTYTFTKEYCSSFAVVSRMVRALLTAIHENWCVRILLLLIGNFV